jgi:hypothetical protein
VTFGKSGPYGAVHAFCGIGHTQGLSTSAEGGALRANEVFDVVSHAVPEAGRHSTFVLRCGGALGTIGGCDMRSQEVPEVGRDSTLVLRSGGALGTIGGCDMRSKEVAEVGRDSTLVLR